MLPYFAALRRAVLRSCPGHHDDAEEQERQGKARQHHDDKRLRVQVRVWVQTCGRRARAVRHRRHKPVGRRVLAATFQITASLPLALLTASHCQSSKASELCTNQQRYGPATHLPWQRPPLLPPGDGG